MRGVRPRDCKNARRKNRGGLALSRAGPYRPLAHIGLWPRVYITVFLSFFLSLLFGLTSVSKFENVIWRREDSSQTVLIPGHAEERFSLNPSLCVR